MIAGPTEGASIIGLAAPGTEVFGSLDAWADRVSQEALRAETTGQSTAILTNAAFFLSSVGRLDAAEPLYQKALASLDGTRESERWRDSIAQRLGQLLRESDRAAEADRLEAELQATSGRDDTPEPSDSRNK